MSLTLCYQGLSLAFIDLLVATDKQTFKCRIEITKHTRSDALPHSSYQNLAGRICTQNSLSAPIQVFQECWSRPCKFEQTWHFGFDLAWTTLWDYVGTGVWRLIAVFPKDTVSLNPVNELCQLKNHILSFYIWGIFG